MGRPGPKPTSTEPVARITFKMPATVRNYVISVGGHHKMSLTIRRMIEFYKEHHPDQVNQDAA